MGTPKSAGELAYERYAEVVGGVDYAGEPLKQFSELSDKIKAGWEAAAQVPPQQTTIAESLATTLQTMRDGRAIGGREWAVAITELEKVYAYWVHFVTN